jgi:hypothetical protein
MSNRLQSDRKTVKVIAKRLQSDCEEAIARKRLRVNECKAISSHRKAIATRFQAIAKPCAEHCESDSEVPSKVAERFQSIFKAIAKRFQSNVKPIDKRSQSTVKASAKRLKRDSK